MKTFIFLLVPFLNRAPCFIYCLHCEGRAAMGGGVLMSIMIQSCNAQTRGYEILEENDVAPYAKNATVKNVITINKYNVGMKSLDRAITVSDTQDRNVSYFYFLGSGSGSGSVSVSVSGSGFRLFHTPIQRPCSSCIKTSSQSC